MSVSKETLKKLKDLVKRNLPIATVTKVEKINGKLKITMSSDYLNDDELIEIWEQMNIAVNRAI